VLVSIGNWDSSAAERMRLTTYMFTRISVSRVSGCSNMHSDSCTYMVLFKQLTGIGSPGLYPLASSGLINGCCPLTALERVTQNEESTSSTNRQEDGFEDMICCEEESKEMEEAGILCSKHVQ
jgi:hypothetical protein